MHALWNMLKRWLSVGKKIAFLVFQGLPVCRQKPNVLIVRGLFFLCNGSNKRQFQWRLFIVGICS